MFQNKIFLVNIKQVIYQLREMDCPEYKSTVTNLSQTVIYTDYKSVTSHETDLT